MENICVTFCAGFIVALLFFKMKVPGGMLIGAVCGTVALSLTTGMAEMPFTAKFIAQVAAGAFIGCSVSIKDIMALRQMRVPAAIVIFSFLALDLILGFTLYSFTALDLITALLSAVPGGMSDVPLIAVDMKADVAEVVVLQFVRLCMGIGFFPAWIAWMYSRKHKANGAPEESASYDAGGSGARSPSAPDTWPGDAPPPSLPRPSPAGRRPPGRWQNRGPSPAGPLP